MNSSNYSYYFKILEAHGIKKGTQPLPLDHQNKVKEVLDYYQSKLPKATAHQRISLKFLSGELFRQKLSQYARPMIVKGVPPLIKDLKELY